MKQKLRLMAMLWPILTIMCLEARAQQSEPLAVTGKVISAANGRAIEGATVTNKRTRIHAVTDRLGGYRIQARRDDILMYSCVGYVTAEEKIAGRNQVIVALDSAENTLQEVEVSTGYQTIPKERATGSFVHIDNELLNRSVSTNILDRLEGVVSGMNFETRNLTRPNQSDITIRGISTINGNMKPLIVVDGFPYEEGQFVTASSQNIIENINPNDIESISVLKDAAAASIWGARAGNGVIVITTKRGKFNQRPSFQFNSSINMVEKPDLYYIPSISSADIIAYEKQIFETGFYNAYDDTYPARNNFPVISQAAEILLAQRRGDISEPEAETSLSRLAASDVRRDIDKRLTRRGVNQQYNVSVRGGADRMSYYGSVGYDNILPGQIGNKNDRLTLRLDNTYRLSPGATISGFLVHTQGRSRNNAGTNVYQNYLPHVNSPYLRLADGDGRPLDVPHQGGYRSAYLDTLSLPGLLDWRYRPIDEIRNADRTGLSSNTRIGSTINYSILPGLSVELKYQFERAFTSSRTYNSLETYQVRNTVNRFMQVNAAGRVSYPFPKAGTLATTIGNQRFHTGRGMLSFNDDRGPNRISAITGVEVRETTFEYNSDNKIGFDPETYTFTTNPDYVTLFQLRPSGTGRIGNSTSALRATANRMVSYFANAGYTYLDRYMVSASARVDASNLLGVKANQRFTPLWSSGIAWVISQEPFFDRKWLSFLKLRATYGYSGNINNDATAYALINYHSFSNVLILDNTAASLSSPPNPGLTWERVHMLNTALDWKALDGRIGGSIEYYEKSGIDLISQIAIDPTSGTTAYTGNNARIRGRGLDIVLQTDNLKGAVKWSTNLLASWNQDRVVDYEIPPTASALLSRPGIPYVGKPLFSVFSYRWEGLDPQTGNPLGYDPSTGQASDNYAAIARNTVAEDLVHHGTATPLIFGALRNDIGWRNVSLSFNISYKLMYFFRKSSISYTNLRSKLAGHGDYAVRWQKPGDEHRTDVPSLQIASSAARDQQYLLSEVLAQRADHARLEDFRLGYTFNASRQQRLPAPRLTLFVYTNNLGVLWKMTKGTIDPAFGDSSIPTPRNTAIGINLTY